MINHTDYVALGLACAEICTALERGMNGKRLDDLSQSVCKAIARLTTWVTTPMGLRGLLADQAPDCRTVAEIQDKVIKQSGRNAASRLFHAKNDKETIAAWKLDLNRILHVFNVRSVVFTWTLLILPLQTELAMNTHTLAADTNTLAMNTNTLVLDIHRNVVASLGGADSQHHPVSVMFNPSTRLCLPFTSPKPGQPFQLLIHNICSHFCTVPLVENCLPLHPGPASGVTG